VPSSSLLADNSLRNATQRISSALAFSTQLLSVIGFYLDCKFPRKLHFHEFDTKHDSNGRNVFLGERQLAHKVAKLNANLFYFCVQQGVDLKLLQPRQTLQNLKLLTDAQFSRRLGNVCPTRLSSTAIQLAEKELGQDLALITDEDQFDLSVRTRGDEGNDDELNELDWESVPEMPYASEALSYSNVRYPFGTNRKFDDKLIVVFICFHFSDCIGYHQHHFIRSVNVASCHSKMNSLFHLSSWKTLHV
jgi:hypothetical protein